jgi:acyl-CoA synthetase (NDP forming)
LSIENTKYTLGLFAKSKIHKIEKIIQTVKTENKVLSLIEAEDVLKVCGIKTPPSEAVRTMSEAWQFGQKHGLPFVLKVSSPMLIHKTEAQAVFTNIYTEADLKKIWARIVATVKKLPKNSDYVVQAQKQIESGLELIAGIKNDANFGNVMMFGAGLSLFMPFCALPIATQFYLGEPGRGKNSAEQTQKFCGEWQGRFCWLQRSRRPL